MHTERSFNPQTDRYEFDFHRCRAAEGWAQIDSRQDASYYGQWANPLQLRYVEYAEGDVTIGTANSPQDFADTLKTWAANANEFGWGFKIDTMCNEKIAKAFRELGLACLFHPQYDHPLAPGE